MIVNENNFRKFVNLNGHEITISGHGVLPKCDNPCFVETEQIILGKVVGIPIAKTNFVKIVNLPDPEDGVFYIVNRIVMNYLPSNRVDVFSVDTGPTAIRDENGQISAVTQLTI